MIIKKNIIDSKAKMNEENKNKANINDKEEYIDYYSIKGKDKYEKDFIFYGGYKSIEIANIMEKHFIIKKVFNPYSLIKFSLLNILTISRGIDSQKFGNKK